MLAGKRFTQEAILKLRSEIKDAGGNEVFALAYLNENALVKKIEIAARGNEAAVLALGHDSGKNIPDVIIHNHPSGRLTPSDNDLVIAGRAAENGLGAYIVDNQVENVYVVAEPAKKRVHRKLDAKAITAALEEGGAIANRLPVYEVRESQLELMRLVIKAFNEDALGAAEAGTGVGKSFAYLLPALSYALINEERIVISTATITLQQQLYEKDIPLVIAALPKVLPKGPKKPLKAVLVKGRGNYICQRRLGEALKEPSLDDDENKSLMAIAKWAETAATGSRSELSFVPADGIWSRICSEGDLCMGLRCPGRDRCFIMALRREAADAQVLVVNHHLLFADLSARLGGAGYENTVVLPPYSRIIIDEAHNIEEAATSFFSGEFSRIGVFRSLSRLYRTNRRGTVKSGLLLRMASMLPSELGNSLLGEMDDEGKGAVGLIKNIREAMDDLDEAAMQLCGYEGVFRLIAGKDERITAILKVPLLAIKKQIRALVSHVRTMLDKVNEKNADESLIWEIKALLRYLENTESLCNAFLEYQENPDKIIWIERSIGNRGGADWAVFSVTPLEVASDLKESLFEPNKCVVCVSATLTVEQSFDYWKNRCGLELVEDKEILTGIFPSPFPYESSVLLGVPSNAPMPTESGFSGFVDNAAAALTEMAGGSALVLFTSYQALKSAWEAAKERLEKQGIRVLKQGDDDRSRLLKTFLEDESSVLFATDSFWEGVDAPGDTLRLVILCRLPFKTPSDPVFEARCESLEAGGGNSFMELSLPEAVMKFKQGFGRLMRRSSDRGVVVVLDSRLLKKQYGRIFLRSLPKTRNCFGDFNDLLRKVEDFLY